MSTSLAEINVVPLVDVMLVLLIIFMVAAPMMTQGMAVNLPQARRAPPVTAQPIYVTVPATFGQERMVQIGKDEIRVDILAERDEADDDRADDKSLFVRADGAVTMQAVHVRDRQAEGGRRREGRRSSTVGR